MFFSAKDREVTFELNASDPSQQHIVDGATLTVVDRTGNVRTLVSDASGVVRLNNVTEGAHAVTASNGDFHSAILVVMREVPATQTGDLEVLGFYFDYIDAIRPVSLRMMKVNPEPLQNIFEQAATAYVDIPLSSIDSNLIETSKVGEQFEGQIQLGKNGSLQGRIVTVMDASSYFSIVEGTHVVVLKDGIPVRKTTVDENGRFRMKGILPGKHGMILFGRGGYAAFSFTAVQTKGLLIRPNSGRLFAMSQLLNNGEVMPVALIPPPIFNRLSGVFTGKSSNDISHNRMTSSRSIKASEIITVKRK